MPAKESVVAFAAGVLAATFSAFHLASVLTGPVLPPPPPSSPLPLAPTTAPTMSLSIWQAASAAVMAALFSAVVTSLILASRQKVLDQCQYLVYRTATAVVYIRAAPALAIERLTSTIDSMIVAVTAVSLSLASQVVALAAMVEKVMVAASAFPQILKKWKDAALLGYQLVAEKLSESDHIVQAAKEEDPGISYITETHSVKQSEEVGDDAEDEWYHIR
ncbi:hypothetical protein CB0940_07946 [Cercospora beticola]|uniref:Uncharacterized protein n=1 Tax=Cercospora beticola TaxID=122368 RepID=A0A2G5H8A2_CERBT|nr:hypothetical protein CB0940_07946 [Cercospora beticola]PIA88757.1 hypothetical protein CB0940_07946 [Cercospora beticola]WPB08497.1 hypothetical protein RHO25_013163 [Cercospora beticola]CAK1356643.1 unnamed protein product [Cercospora beticola]